MSIERSERSRRFVYTECYFVISLFFVLSCNQSPSQTQQASKNVSSDRLVASNFTLLDIDGNQYILEEQKGKVVFLNFWATWCPPCRTEIPILISLYSKYKDKGFTILGIGLDKEQSLKMFAKENSITYPVLIGTDKVAQSYKIKAIPTTYVLDKQGMVAFQHTGLAPELEQIFEQEIQLLLDEH